MYWQEAIKQSKKGTAIRKQKNGNHDETFVRYDDGSCFKLVAENGKVLYGFSKEIEPKEIEGYDDWKPSE